MQQCQNRNVNDIEGVMMAQQSTAHGVLLSQTERRSAHRLEVGQVQDSGEVARH